MAELYDQHAPGLYAYALAITGDALDAEDILHEVFVRALGRQQSFLGLRNPTGYLYRATRNAAYSCWRRKTVRERIPKDPPRQQIVEPRDDASDVEETERMNEALHALPLEQREVVLLKFFQDMTFREIGRVLRCSTNTAASRYRYALAKLRDILGEETHGND